MIFGDVREAVSALIQAGESSDIRVGGHPATVADIQELVREEAYALADLLGMSDLYLK